MFVTYVLLGDDNTVCVTCDPQRHCKQFEKHSRCESRTSTLPLERSTVQRIVQNVDTVCGPRGLTDLLGWKTQVWGLFAFERDGSASKIFQPARGLRHQSRSKPSVFSP